MAINRLVSISEDGSFPPAAKVTESNLPERLKTPALDAAYAPQLVNGKAPVRRGELVNNVVDFGARPDSYLDDSTAIQNAINAGGITYFPPGTYVASGLSAVNGMNLRGAGIVGAGRTRIRCSSGVLFNTPGATALYGTKVSDLVFDSFGGGGDLFRGLWSLGKFEDCTFVQYQNNASCFNVTGWIDMLTIRCTFDHTFTATVPTFKAVSDVGELAQSSFLSNRFTKTGDYAIHLEGIMGSVVETFTIRDTNFEEPKGGAIRLLSARNCKIEAPGMWDFHDGGATKHLIHIGTSPNTGAISSNNEISHYIRDASLGPGPGVYDINVGAGTTFTSIKHPRHQINGNILINMLDTTGLIIGDNQIIDSDTFATVISSKFIKFPRVTIGQRATPAAAGKGAFTFDESNGVPIYSDGANWRRFSDNTITS